MSWLIVAVSVVLPFEALAYDHPLGYVSLPARTAVLLAIVATLRVHRISAILAGRLFIAFGLASMVFWSLLADSAPDRVALEAAAYGTILSILVLLIAPRDRRRQWSLAVVVVVLIPAVTRLLPDHPILFVQVCAVLLVHSAALAVLDVHARRAEQAGDLARFDPLTGLYNRRPTVETLTACIETFVAGVDSDTEPAASSVIVIDLDHFKVVNDTFGHEAGDLTLCEVAAVLRRVAGPSDTVSRWGGEEFLVVLPGAAESDAVAIAERMRHSVGLAGVSASFGVSEVEAGDTAATCVRRADEAMYESKRAGRNRVTASSGLARISDDQVSVEPNR